ncbi:ATP-binding protein [bacterium]|nr:ATP-binding protein [bacterium]
MKLAITSGKGGVGKSMISAALSMLFAKERKVLAVDCDADAPNLDIWLGGIKKWDKAIPLAFSLLPYIDYKKCDGCGICAERCKFGAIKMVNGKPTVNSFLCEGCGLCEHLCPKKAIKMKPVDSGVLRIKKRTKYGFPLISGQLLPGRTGSGKMVDRTKFEAEKFNYDLMIIDSAPGTGCPVIAALRDANFAVLVTEPTLSAFSDLKKVLEVVEHFKIPWGLIVNKWGINNVLAAEIRKYANKKFLGKVSYDRKIFQAVSNLTPILETRLKAREEIEKIYYKLNKLL